MNSRIFLLMLGMLAGLLSMASGAPPSRPGGSIAPGVGQVAPVHRGRFLMGTSCTLTAYGDDPVLTAAALEEALDTIAAAEALLSTWRPDTELAMVNRQAADKTLPISLELNWFLDESLRLARALDGAFDPSVGALIDAWDLRGDGRVPSAADLTRALLAVGYERVHLDELARTVRFDVKGLWIDTGAVGKGYALDQAADTLRRRGVSAALLDFGGQVLAVGAPPGELAWTVAVADPRDRQRPALVLALRDASAATSSQWERGRIVAGRAIGHILDPRTGRPVAWNGSTTVVAADAMQADALATGLFVLGPLEGRQWASREGLGVAYLTPTDGAAGASGLSLLATPALETVLSSTVRDVVRP